MEPQKGSSYVEQNAIAKAQREVEKKKKVLVEKTAKDIIENADFSDTASIKKTIFDKQGK